MFDFLIAALSWLKKTTAPVKITLQNYQNQAAVSHSWTILFAQVNSGISKERLQTADTSTSVHSQGKVG